MDRPRLEWFIAPAATTNFLCGRRRDSRVRSKVQPGFLTLQLLRTRKPGLDQSPQDEMTHGTRARVTLFDP